MVHFHTTKQSNDRRKILHKITFCGPNEWLLHIIYSLCKELQCLFAVVNVQRSELEDREMVAMFAYRFVATQVLEHSRIMWRGVGGRTAGGITTVAAGIIGQAGKP